MTVLAKLSDSAAPPGYTLLMSEVIHSPEYPDPIFRGTVQTPTTVLCFCVIIASELLGTDQFWDDFWQQMEAAK